ncbi:4Fe-4S double cluster binding domain-containing protein [Caproicibacter sp.]|uniref:4Fe-4S double cluster binding domain-containing protein n=1 Tax=Caproicibacter sp. TaxID=2814884 RepID=UPI0039891E89
MIDLNKELREILFSEGAELAGVGSLAAAAPEELPFGVSVAVSLSAEVIASLPNGPAGIYYDAYFELNRRLDRIVTAGADYLTRSGYRAHAQTTSAVREFGNYRTALPHKTVATRAGIGWIGKCALLVTEQFGPAVRLSSLTTDAPLSCAEPIDESCCGPCTACGRACPGHAVSGRLWHVGMDRDEFFDPLACRKAARELAAEKLHQEITLCGRCIAACPYTKRYLNRMRNEPAR